MQNINGVIRPEIGYHIRVGRQRKGYAKEADSAVRDWGFSHTPFQILYSYMKAENTASAKTAESLGMHLTDTYTDGENGCMLVYSVSRASGAIPLHTVNDHCKGKL